MCDSNDGCLMVPTTCCHELRPQCETRETVASDGHITETTCVIGFGCAPDAAHYIAKLQARFS